ncbi:DNA polymerase-3 subunit epsilon [Gramella sp. Hel_I_59]|uniref:3'-5' exonuclease n=1 Tax=Gramella sp. Hel_I_59 TaxID=1249978 RepID=UPI0011527E96|nr:3'-5' exonuclease [Gramella sp. Hel_I_59]TQI70559.1 DNA polymerase-3 subunit epsilon [Gramella sp. Hel_I_59]
MIREWFKKDQQPEDLPDYFTRYLSLFDKDKAEDVADQRFVVFDTETTGFDINEDRILSIGAIAIKNNKLKVRDHFEVYLKQDTFNPETVKIHGIIKNERFAQLQEAEALEQFIKYIGNSILVAHHAGFDKNMINKALERNGLPRLQNKFLDTAILYKKTRIATNFIDKNKVYSLDEIAEDYNIDLTDRHTASGDAFITALIFMKLIAKIDAKNIKIRKLLRYRY